VLIVDDEKEIRRPLAEFLQGRGHRIVVGHSGAEALALAGRRRFDAVLLDILMPGMDGIEALRRLKKADPSVLVIMISGATDEAAAAEALALGAFDYIRKPFDFHDLERVLATGLAMRG